MKKILFFLLLLSTSLTVSFLSLPKLFFMNLLMFLLTTAVLITLCAWATSKCLSSKKLLQHIQLGFLVVTAAISSVAIFLVEYPFWISIPDGFCNSKRAKTVACQLESEIINTEDEHFPIYVVGHGWHTGLMLRTKDLPKEMFPKLNLSNGPAIEIGWGSESFYRASDYTFKLGFKSFVFPNPSVLHVVIMPDEAEQNFQHSDLYVYWASHAEYKRMLEFVMKTFTKDDNGVIIDLGPGIYGNSRFYRANGTYHFPKSCNAWTANAVVAAGAPIWPSLALTARNTLHQLRLVGDEIRRTEGFKILPK